MTSLPIENIFSDDRQITFLHGLIMVLVSANVDVTDGVTSLTRAIAKLSHPTLDGLLTSSPSSNATSCFPFICCFFEQACITLPARRKTSQSVVGPRLPS